MAVERGSFRFVVVALATALAWLAAPSALAGGSSDGYRVTVRPQEGGRAHVTIEKAYRTTLSIETQPVGRTEPHAVHTTSRDGAPLRALRKRDEHGGWQIVHDLPKPDASGTRLVTITFEQDLRRTYRLDGTRADVTWAHEGTVPGGDATLRVIGPLARDGEGLACSGEGEDRVCERTSADPFATPIPLGPASRTWQLAWLLVASGAVVLLVHAALKRRSELIEERGILPASSLLAYPTSARPDGDGFRPPPALPRPEVTTPILSEDDRMALGFKSASALALLLAGQLLVARLLVAPFEVAAVLAAFVVAMGLPLARWLRGEGATTWLVAAILPGAVTVLVVDMAGSVYFLALLLLVVPFLWIAPPKRQLPARDIAGATASSCGGGSFEARGGGCGG